MKKYVRIFRTIIHLYLIFTGHEVQRKCYINFVDEVTNTISQLSRYFPDRDPQLCGVIEGFMWSGYIKFFLLDGNTDRRWCCPSWPCCASRRTRRAGGCWGTACCPCWACAPATGTSTCAPSSACRCPPACCCSSLSR